MVVAGVGGEQMWWTWVGIRHVRYGWHAWQMARWYAMWQALGYMGPAESDLARLEAIWQGEA